MNLLDLPPEILVDFVTKMGLRERFYLWALVNKHCHMLSFTSPLPTLCLEDVPGLPTAFRTHATQRKKEVSELTESDLDKAIEASRRHVEAFFAESPFLKAAPLKTVKELDLGAFDLTSIDMQHFALKFPGVEALKVGGIYDILHTAAGPNQHTHIHLFGYRPDEPKIPGEGGRVTFDLLAPMPRLTSLSIRGYDCAQVLLVNFENLTKLDLRVMLHGMHPDPEDPDSERKLYEPFSSAIGKLRHLETLTVNFPLPLTLKLPTLKSLTMVCTKDGDYKYIDSPNFQHLESLGLILENVSKLPLLTYGKNLTSLEIENYSRNLNYLEGPKFNAIKLKNFAVITSVPVAIKLDRFENIKNLESLRFKSTSSEVALSSQLIEIIGQNPLIHTLQLQGPFTSLSQIAQEVKKLDALNAPDFILEALDGVEKGSAISLADIHEFLRGFHNAANVRSLHLYNLPLDAEAVALVAARFTHVFHLGLGFTPSYELNDSTIEPLIKMDRLKILHIQRDPDYKDPLPRSTSRFSLAMLKKIVAKFTQFDNIQVYKTIEGIDRAMQLRFAVPIANKAVVANYYF